jgi:mRNA-degrading endonuclease RelE of RelBE toxin-antitoxin system
MKVFFTSAATKKLKKIKVSDKIKAWKKIEILNTNPFSGKLLRGELNNLRSLKAWPLRVIYNFNNKTKVITIVDIDYRGDVYK